MFSTCSLPKGLREQLLRGKLEQWSQPKIFSTPKPVFLLLPSKIAGRRPGIKGTGLMARSPLGSPCGHAVVRTLTLTSLFPLPQASLTSSPRGSKM